MLTFPTAAEARRRLPRLIVGLLLCGAGIAGMVLARLGLGPWDVFHQGVSDRTGVPIGTVGIVFGFLVLLAWVPLRQRVGLGTLINIVLIGVVIDVVLAVVEPPSSTAARWALMVSGPVLVGIGSGFYIGAGLGPGPRDGVMTGLVARGWPTWAVRTGIEVSVLLMGWALGGTVGLGTIWFAVGIGPLVHLSLHHLSIDPVEPTTLIGAE